MLFGWERRQPAAFLRDLHGGARHADVCVLDPVRQFLDDPGRLRIENGVAVPVDWFKIIFNPSFLCATPTW